MLLAVVPRRNLGRESEAKRDEARRGDASRGSVTRLRLSLAEDANGIQSSGNLDAAFETPTGTPLAT